VYYHTGALSFPPYIAAATPPFPDPRLVAQKDAAAATTAITNTATKLSLLVALACVGPNAVTLHQRPANMTTLPVNSGWGGPQFSCFETPGNNENATIKPAINTHKNMPLH